MCKILFQNKRTSGEGVVLEIRTNPDKGRGLGVVWKSEILPEVLNRWPKVFFTYGRYAGMLAYGGRNFLKNWDLKKKTWKNDEWEKLKSYNSTID